jgi:hypothetical protein
MTSKSSLTSPPADEARLQQLRTLYARKSIIDGLIRSLEEYDRSRVSRNSSKRMKAA